MISSACTSTGTDLADRGRQPDALSGASALRGELRHFVTGRATYRPDVGEVIDVCNGTVVMFPAGWTGERTVHGTIAQHPHAGLKSMIPNRKAAPAKSGHRFSDKIMPNQESAAWELHDMPTPHWPDAATVPLEDWGAGTNTLAGAPRAFGRILFKNPDGSSECGLWSCTPGTRKVTFAVDEFCHFLSGRGSYVHENGEQIPVEAGTLAFFPAGWTGICIITETLTKAFMCC